MKKFLPSFFLKFLLIILFITFYATSLIKAQRVQITLTGFNHDVIAEPVLNTDPTTITNSTIDIAPPGHVFFAQGYGAGSSAYPNGLPVSGQIPSPGNFIFQLAAYTTNNDLRMVANDVGTLTFNVSNQRKYDSLFILGTAGNGLTQINYTINFKTLPSKSGSLLFNDWYCNTCTSYAINALDRVNVTTKTNDGSPVFAMYADTILLSVADSIVSINFNVPSNQTGVGNIFAITGNQNSLLPVTLEYYTASLVNGKALLQWKTSQEFNNKQFIIERSTSADPSSFVEVGRVNALSSANGSTYNFTNDPGVSGTFLYRLKQEDIDGQIKILGIKSVTFNSKAKWVVQDLGSEWRLICEQPFTYQLLDFNGRILQAASGSGSATISKPASQGIYQIQVLAGGAFSTQKLLK